jgi:hypothetical protein
LLASAWSVFRSLNSSREVFFFVMLNFFTFGFVLDHKLGYGG